MTACYIVVTTSTMLAMEVTEEEKLDQEHVEQWKKIITSTVRRFAVYHKQTAKASSDEDFEEDKGDIDRIINNLTVALNAAIPLDNYGLFLDSITVEDNPVVVKIAKKYCTCSISNPLLKYAIEYPSLIYALFRHKITPLLGSTYISTALIKSLEEDCLSKEKIELLKEVQSYEKNWIKEQQEQNPETKK